MNPDSLRLIDLWANERRGIGCSPVTIKMEIAVLTRWQADVDCAPSEERALDALLALAEQSRFSLRSAQVVVRYLDWRAAAGYGRCASAEQRRALAAASAKWSLALRESFAAQARARRRAETGR